MAETQEIIQRESPELEALKIGLIEQAKALTGTPPTGGLPTLEAAGIDPLQAQAATIAHINPLLLLGKKQLEEGKKLSRQEKHPCKPHNFVGKKG